METTEQTTTECKPCVLGMALVGLLAGLALVFIAVDVLTGYRLTGRRDTDATGE